MSVGKHLKNVFLEVKNIPINERNQRQSGMERMLRNWQ